MVRPAVAANGQPTSHHSREFVGQTAEALHLNVMRLHDPADLAAAETFLPLPGFALAEETFGFPKRPTSRSPQIAEIV